MERITEMHVAVAIVGYYGNGEHWGRNEYTNDVDLALMGQVKEVYRVKGELSH